MDAIGPLPNTRKFSGRTFYLQNIIKSKREASRLAKTMRAEGHRARVIKKKDSYLVYVS